MGFWVNRQVEPELLGAQGGQTRAQSLLICLGLIYLAIPNVLFLWGWFTPPVALGVSALMLLALGRAALLTLRGCEPSAACGRCRPFAMVAGLLLALLVLAFFILRLGVLGFVPSFIDFDIIRNALFCNLRDAAWPLIFPDGREMSYYIAGTLPPALLARLAPESGQWAVVLWTAGGMLLTLLLVSSALPSRRYCWGTRLMLVTLFMACICCPLTSYNLGPRVLGYLRDGAGIDLMFLCPVHRLSCSNVLNNGAMLYNSSPYAFMLVAMLVVCRHRAEAVLPAALALVVPLSPFAGIALLPLVLVRWADALRGRGAWRLGTLAVDSLLPAAMAVVAAVYFTRQDGKSAATLTGLAWNWPEFWMYEAWLILGWLLLVLPLLFLRQRRDALSYTLLACCVLLPFAFIGARPAPGMGEHNELWLKAAPMYLMLVGCWWLAAWRRIGWYKYLLVGFCAFTLLAQVALYADLFSKRTHAYLEVDDQWNGHLCHDAPFIHRMVPPCKEPMLPGVMLREAGESERHFPGCLLPKAPGCDYTRPARVGGPKVKAPM